MANKTLIIQTSDSNNIAVSDSSFTYQASISQPTPQISIDLTTLSGWNSLASGNHTITVKAKATGYRDSEASEAVIINKNVY